MFAAIGWSFLKRKFLLIPFRHNQFVVSIVGIHDTSFHYFSYSDYIKTMTAWEKLRFNQVTTLEKVTQNKIGFTTLRSVIGQKKNSRCPLIGKKKNSRCPLNQSDAKLEQIVKFSCFTLVSRWLFVVPSLSWLNVLKTSVKFCSSRVKRVFFWCYDFQGSLHFHDFTIEHHFKVLFRLTFSRFTVFLVVHLFCEHRGNATTVTNLPCVTLFTRLQFV